MSEQILIEEELPPMQSKRIAIMVGRFQPPTIGHYKVINKMVDAIRKYNVKNTDAKLETNPVVGIISGKKTSKLKSRNPLTPDDVEKIMKASGNIDAKTIFIHARSLFDVFAKARKLGYEPIMVLGGDDRGVKGDAPYKDILDKYFKTPDDKPIQHDYVSIKRSNAANLNDEAQDTLLDMIEKDGEVEPEVVSGTLARRAAERNLSNAFASILGLQTKKAIAKIAFKKVKAGIEHGDEE